MSALLTVMADDLVKPVAPGWQLDNQKAAVVMAEPNGRALMGLRLTSSEIRCNTRQYSRQSFQDG